MADIVTHAFVTTKPDSPDPSLVSASEWNEGHVLQGGSNGQVLVFDNTQVKNARFIDGGAIASASATGPTGGTTVTGIAPITFTATSNEALFISLTAYAEASVAAVINYFVIINGVSVYGQGVVLPFSSALSWSHVAARGPGACTVAVNATLSVGVINALDVRLSLIRIGIL